MQSVTGAFEWGASDEASGRHFERVRPGEPDHGQSAFPNRRRNRRDGIEQHS
jgi:hypothetical protein